MECMNTSCKFYKDGSCPHKESHCHGRMTTDFNFFPEEQKDKMYALYARHAVEQEERDSLINDGDYTDNCTEETKERLLTEAFFEWSDSNKYGYAGNPMRRYEDMVILAYKLYELCQRDYDGRATGVKTSARPAISDDSCDGTVTEIRALELAEDTSKFFDVPQLNLFNLLLKLSLGKCYEESTNGVVRKHIFEVDISNYIYKQN